MPDRSQRPLFVIYILMLIIGGSALFYAIDGATVVSEINASLGGTYSDVELEYRPGVQWDAHYQGLHEYYYPDSDWTMPHYLFGLDHHPAGDLLWLFGACLLPLWLMAFVGFTLMMALPLVGRRKVKPGTQAKSLRVGLILIGSIIASGLIAYQPTIDWIATVLD